MKTTFKILRYFFITIFLLSTGMLAGCKQIYPPNTSINNPVIAFDGLGNMIYAYQITVGTNQSARPETYLQKIDPDGKPWWGGQGIFLTGWQAPSATYTDIICDGKGNSVIFWVANNQLEANKIDANGNDVWAKPVQIGGTAGSAHIKIQSDTQGIFIAWVEYRGANNILHFQTLDYNGNLLNNGGKTIPNVYPFDAFCDKDGNPWILYESTLGLQLQKRDKTGKTDWSVFLKQLPNTTSMKYRTVSEEWLFDDGSGNALVGWVDNYDTNVFNLQKVNSSGRVVWKIAEPVIGDDSGSGYRVEADGNGGLFVLWMSDNLLLAQHINADGQPTWDKNGLLVSADVSVIGRNPDYYIIRNNTGGVTLVWDTLVDSHYIFHFQQVSENAELLSVKNSPPINGSFLFYTRQYTVPMFSDGGNYIYLGYLVASFQKNSYIQKIGVDGTLPWGPDGLNVDAWYTSVPN
jgi:hypothetical protein